MRSRFHRATGLLAPVVAIVTLALPSAASAQIFNFGVGYFSGCGLSHSEPFALPIKNDGSLSLASINLKNTILLDDDADGTTRVKQSATLRIFNADGTLDWKAGPYVLTSNSFVFSLNGPGFEGVVPGVFPDVSSHLAVYPAFGTECVGAGVAESNGKRYVVMSVGTAASSGTATAPEDLSLINLVVLNAANGNKVFTHKIRPRNGWFLSGFVFGGPGIVDYDGDGNMEVVVVRVRGLPKNNAEFLYEFFDLVTGQRIRNTRIVQKNVEINQNPESGDIPPFPFP